MINRENEKNRLLSERQGEQNRLNLLSVQDRRTAETDAFKKIQDAGFILRGGASQYQSPAMTIRGKSSQLPGLNRPAPSASETAAATTLNEQMLARLQPGTGWKPDFTWEPEFNYTPRPFDERDTGPSTLERIGNWGAIATGGLGALDMLTGGRSTNALGGLISTGAKGIGRLFGIGGSSGTIPTSSSYTNMGVNAGMGGNAAVTGGSRIAGIMGKAAPIAGAAMGTYGLLKDRGMVNNIANGAMAGAGYGS